MRVTALMPFIIIETKTDIIMAALITKERMSSGMITHKEQSPVDNCLPTRLLLLGFSRREGSVRVFVYATPCPLDGVGP